MCPAWLFVTCHLQEDSFLRPTILEGIPSQPSLYQVIPWEHTSTGDLLKHKDPEVAVSVVVSHLRLQA